MPFSIAVALFGGLVGKKVFDEVWGLFDEEEPPEGGHRDVPFPKLLIALALEGAIFKLVKGLIDRSLRSAFYRTTGSWPGEIEPEPE